MTRPTTRRQFISEVVAGAAIAALADDVLSSQQPASATGLPTRTLGRTGQRVSILCLGGWHIGSIKTLPRPFASCTPRSTKA